MADENKDLDPVLVQPVAEAPVKADPIPDEEKTKELDKKEADADAEPKAYMAPHDVFVSNQFHKAGDVFVTNANKEDTWTELEADKAEAIDASQQKVPADVDYSAMDQEALVAIAAIKHVNPTGMDKDQLVDAIKAANEPKL